MINLPNTNDFTACIGMSKLKRIVFLTSLMMSVFSEYHLQSPHRVYDSNRSHLNLSKNRIIKFNIRIIHEIPHYTRNRIHVYNYSQLNMVIFLIKFITFSSLIMLIQNVVCACKNVSSVRCIHGYIWRHFGVI